MKYEVIIKSTVVYTDKATLEATDQESLKKQVDDLSKELHGKNAAAHIVECKSFDGTDYYFAYQKKTFKVHRNNHHWLLISDEDKEIISSLEEEYDCKILFSNHPTLGVAMEVRTVYGPVS